MIRSAWQFYLSHRYQFTKYVIVGVSGLVLDMGTLLFFREWLGLGAVLAVMINQVIVLGYNFSLHKFWSFESKGMIHGQIVRYIMLAVGNYIISVFAMYVFHRLLGYDYLVVRISTIAVSVSWNFLLLKYWVYRQARQTTTREMCIT